MQQQGAPLDACMAQQLVHLYCDAAMWGHALQLLEQEQLRSSSSGGGGAGPAGGRGGGGGAAGGASVARVRQPVSADGYGLSSDSLWHMVWRQVVHRNAPDDIVTEFARCMEPHQLQRFQLMYEALRRRADGSYTVGPLEEADR